MDISNGVKLTNTAYRVLEFFPESDPLKNRAKDKALVIMENLISANETSGWLSFQKEKIKLQIVEDIDILLGYFWIGKTQGWLNSTNCLIITSEYEKIKKDLTPVIELPQQPSGEDESLIEEEYMQTEVQDDLKPALEEVENGMEELTNFPEDMVAQESDEVEPVAFSGSKTQSLHELTGRQKKIIDFLTSNEKAQVMDLKKILPDVTKRTIRRDLDQLMEFGKIVRFGDFNQVFYQIKRLG